MKSKNEILILDLLTHVLLYREIVQALREYKDIHELIGESITSFSRKELDNLYTTVSNHAEKLDKTVHTTTEQYKEEKPLSINILDLLMLDDTTSSQVRETHKKIGGSGDKRIAGEGEEE